MHILLLYLILFFTRSSSYSISWEFREYLNERYGVEIAKTLYRPEIYRSSVGGNEHIPGEQTNKIPLVFIHGLGTRAGDYVSIQKEFKEAGYKLEEIYAFTWGTPGSFFTGVTLECKHVIQIRRFIEAVSDFTNSKVDIIAYSMGSTLARKAIMGGHCVDNFSIDLGPPITRRVQTFLAVAGANSGSHLCATATTQFCNAITGMQCNSSFIRDINSRRGYEASEILVIYNPQDEWIGEASPCGYPYYALPGAEYHPFPLSFHADILWKSAPEQLALIMRKYAMNGLLQNIRNIKMRPIPSARIIGNQIMQEDEEVVIPRRRLHDGTTKRPRFSLPTAADASASSKVVRLVALQASDEPPPTHPERVLPVLQPSASPIRKLRQTQVIAAMHIVVPHRARRTLGHSRAKVFLMH